MKKLKQQDRLEHEKLRLERDKLNQTRESDQAKQKEERRKTLLTAASILVSAITLAATIWFGIHSEREKASADFEIKAAELVIQSQTPDEGYGRALALKNLFGHRLSSHFADTFDPKNYRGEPAPESPEPKLTLRKLTLENPKQKQEIINKWIKLFPSDESWAKELR